MAIPLTPFQDIALRLSTVREAMRRQGVDLKSIAGNCLFSTYEVGGSRNQNEACCVIIDFETERQLYTCVFDLTQHKNDGSYIQSVFVPGLRAALQMRRSMREVGPSVGFQSLADLAASTLGREQADETAEGRERTASGSTVSGARNDLAPAVFEELDTDRMTEKMVLTLPTVPVGMMYFCGGCVYINPADRSRVEGDPRFGIGLTAEQMDQLDREPTPELPEPITRAYPVRTRQERANADQRRQEALSRRQPQRTLNGFNQRVLDSFFKDDPKPEAEPPKDLTKRHIRKRNSENNNP